MISLRLGIATALALAFGGGALAQAPVGQPVSAPVSLRSAASRTESDGVAEKMVRANLTAQGFEVRSVKLPGDQGNELVAMRRSASGSVADVRLVEVKTSRGSSAARGQRSPQASRSRLEQVRRLLGVVANGAKLVREIDQFLKDSGFTVADLGEVHLVDTLSDLVVVIDTGKDMVDELRTFNDTLSKKPTDSSAKRPLPRAGKKVIERAETRAAAVLRQTSKSLLALSRGALKVAAVLAKVAGPLMIASYAFDAYQLYTLYADFRAGNLSQREFTIQAAVLLSGMAGSLAGGAAGAYYGLLLGALAGPQGAVVGALLGGFLGAATGYFGCSWFAEKAVDSWFDSLDNKVRDGIKQWLIHSHVQLSPRP